MKILYFSSGFTHIYPYFDKWIYHQLKTFDHIEVQIVKKVSHMKYLCHTFQPNLVITLVGDNLPIETLEFLRRMNIITALWLTEDPFYIDLAIQHIPFYDFVFTIDVAAYQFYKNNGIKNVYHLSLGTDPITFSPKKEISAYESDICMIGYPYEGRIRMINKLLKETSYKIVVSGKWSSYLKASNRLLILKGWIPPKKVSYYYSNAKIVLNTHRAFNEKMNRNTLGIVNQSINNRTFDIAACRAFQLVEYKKDLPTYFIEDKEIVSFKDDEDLLNKIDYFIKNKDVRAEFAENARQRVLKDHTIKHRLNIMLETISEN